ncbi:hypothetical protein AGLY_017900 [Aphis glycines]|uniref:Uncharacterized protein n=1 Tax=Aphis glycines TaxID=307491 RepID=A0A6G0SVL3_APHGL|nr:hypothetical protein AGLY_017900 [Aphis glycines]
MSITHLKIAMFCTFWLILKGHFCPRFEHNFMRQQIVRQQFKRQQIARRQFTPLHKPVQSPSRGVTTTFNSAKTRGNAQAIFVHFLPRYRLKIKHLRSYIRQINQQNSPTVTILGQIFSIFRPNHKSIFKEIGNILGYMIHSRSKSNIYEHLLKTLSPPHYVLITLVAFVNPILIVSNIGQLFKFDRTESISQINMPKRTFKFYEWVSPVVVLAYRQVTFQNVWCSSFTIELKIYKSFSYFFQNLKALVSIFYTT